MSLVAYQSSSDDSDEDSLVESKKRELENLVQVPKKKEPVRIAVPSLDEFDEEEDAKPSKKPKLKVSSGLLSMLPSPKYSGLSSKSTLLVPHTVSQRKSPPSKKSETNKDLSAINAPSKPKCEQTVITDQKMHNTEEHAFSKDYFSLETGSTSVPKAIPIHRVIPSSSQNTYLAEKRDTGIIVSDHNFSQPSMKISNFRGDIEKTVMCNATSSSAVSDEGSNVSEQTSPEVESFSANEPKDIINDEGFLRLQGKKMRGLEDVNIIDICGDNLVADKTEWHTKSISEEKKVTHSRKKNDMPTQTQKRKHQITYLAFQAKERELDLKNQWAQNRLTKQQTQSKYGF